MNIFKVIGRIRPETFFVWAAMLLGTVLTVIMPPLQSPDELNHFYRAYQVSEGHFLPERTAQRLGGQMPAVFVEFSEPFMKAAGNEYYRIRRQDIVKTFRLNIRAGDTQFQDFPNTAYYSPVSYAPQALALFVLRQCHASAGLLYYGARLFAFIVWLFSMYQVLKLLPRFKWLFAVLLLLPMHVYIANSFSADTVTNILVFFLLALVLRHLAGAPFRTKHLLYFLLIGLLLALAKVIYVALLLLLIALPLGSFRSARHKWSALSIIVFCSFLLAYVWSGTIMQYYISYAAYDPAFRALASVAEGSDYYLQKDHLLTHPFYFFKVVYNTLVGSPGFYLRSYMGGFGTYLHLFMPWWVTGLSFAFIVFTVLTESGTLVLSYFQKLVLLVTAVVTFLLLLVTQHLTWNFVGWHEISFLQGRYLIPIFPLFFLLLSPARNWRSLPTGLLTILFVVCISSYGLYFIYTGFIKDLSYSSAEFYCGAEERDAEGYFKTSNPAIRLGGGESQSADAHRNGKYSVKLSPAAPYSFSYQFKNLDARDLVEVEAWQKGTGAVLVIAGKGKDCGEFYFPEQAISYSDTGGWTKIHMVFSMWQHCNGSEAGFYLFNPGKSTIYVDDVHFCMKKFKDDVQHLMPH